MTSPTLLIARRELRAVDGSMLAYVITAAVLLIDGIYFYSFALSGAELSPKYSKVLRRCQRDRG